MTNHRLGFREFWSTRGDLGLSVVRTGILAGTLSVALAGAIVQFTRHTATEFQKVEPVKPSVRISSDYKDAFLRPEGQIWFRSYASPELRYSLKDNSN
jgi:hypothetical protein